MKVILHEFSEVLVLICVSSCVWGSPTIQNVDIWSDNYTAENAELFGADNMIIGSVSAKNVSDLSRMPRGMFI